MEMYEKGQQIKLRCTLQGCQPFKEKKRGKRNTRPVWTGFKIAVKHKLLTHYKKAKVLYNQSKDGLKLVIVKNIYSIKCQVDMK